jgi:7-cyano-7-deazaguanine synthase
MEQNPFPALVLLSGGQDSTTCLYWALQNFSSVKALIFDYGQRHRVEVQCAENIAGRANVRYRIMDIAGLLSDSALIDAEAEITASHELNSNLPASFVPGRNALFLTLACSYAYTLGIRDVVMGVCQTDYSGYPDCRESFIKCQAKAISLALDTEIRIHTPLMHLTKAETWKMAAKLGCLEVIRNNTHTDYNGDHTTFNEWGYGKLDNPASVLRAQGYEEAKAKGWV